MTDTLSSVEAVAAELKRAGYVCNDDIATVVHLANVLEKPILAEGPAGTGKTELAKAVARVTGRQLIRLQCYEGLDESKVLYEWDYRKQLLRLQKGDDAWTELFDEQFLLVRPLLAAMRSPEPVVLLIDEIDRIEEETEALLLEVLSDFQVSIPELGTLTAVHKPFVVLTSNNSRQLSDALKRRCLFLHMPYPTMEREVQIIRSHVPDLDESLATRVAEAIAVLRSFDLDKPPAVSEAIDWARALSMQDIEQVGVDEIRASFPLLLKHRADTELAMRRLADLGR